MATEGEIASAWQPLYVALGPDDLEAIFALHLIAIRAIGRPELVKPESKDFFRRILAGQGGAIGVVQDDALVAYGILQLELPSSEDARPLLGLKSGDSLAKLAGASVLPSAWGAGLHSALIDCRIAEARKLSIRHLYSTAAPGNARSWANLIDAGFAIRAIIEKYGGHLRYLLYRDLSTGISGDGKGMWCDAADIVRQRLLIANGFAGTGWRRREDGGRDIHYRERA